MKSMPRVGLPLLFLAISAARADSIATSPTLIDFEIVPPNTPVLEVYRSQGVIFSFGLFGDPFPVSSMNGTREATNFDGNLLVANPLVITFTNPQTRVGFWAAGTLDGGTIFVQAFQSSSLVGEATFRAQNVQPGGDLPSVFVSLDVPGGFDRIQVSALDSRVFSIDDLIFGGTPGSSTPSRPPALDPAPPYVPPILWPDGPPGPTPGPGTPPGGPDTPPGPDGPPGPDTPPGGGPTEPPIKPPIEPPIVPPIEGADVPEPSTWILMGAGLAALVAAKARKR